MSYIVRPATLKEVPLLEQLITFSVRQLSQQDYSAAQIESSIRYIFGVDTALIADQSYFVVEAAGQIAGCGGWSRRATLFGGDQYEGRQDTYIDPVTRPAKIRAFFVHPDWARKGIGTLLLKHCEAEIRQYGFSAIEMMATLPGKKLYEQYGYTSEEYVNIPMLDGNVLPCVVMEKQIK